LEIVLRAFGGLGNQLFQYAAGRYYAKRYGATLRISVEWNAQCNGFPRPCLLSHFTITAPLAERSMFERILLTHKEWLKATSGPVKRALRIKVFTEQFEHRYSFLRDLPLERDVNMLCLLGYFQTNLLVEEIANELRAELTLKDLPRGKNLELLQQISRSRNPVSLHVRRGDCSVAATKRVDLPLEYYLNAISFFKQRLGNPVFFVFSDEIPFVKKYLPQNIATVFVDHNDDFSAHEDMRLMSCCHHNIIANSTFSWWGAWLNPRADKIIIAPKHWYNTEDSYYPDLLPRTWKLVDIATSFDRSFNKIGDSSTVLI
jgi:Glycosyl transferase family 11